MSITLKRFFSVLILILSAFQLFFASQVLADSWQPMAIDARRAIKNNQAQPARLEPKNKLKPLPTSSIGAIRRVNPTNNERVVALTFDLCELATVTTGCDMELLGFLHNQGIAATLFMGGKWMRTHDLRTKQLLQDPLFEIANHAWSHGNCVKLSPQALQNQVLWTQAQYELLREEVEAALTDRDKPRSFLPVPKLFRPPYARCNKENLTQIAQMGLYVILWDVVAETRSVSNEHEANKMAQSVVNQVKPGSIILFHANLVPKGTALLVRAVVQKLAALGYKFVTVSNLLPLGVAEKVYDGYFTRPNDNVRYDTEFGVDGTGIKK